MKTEPVILQLMRKKDSRGRKPRDPREVLNGISWALRPGAPCQACRRRFRQWVKAGAFRRIAEELAAGLTRRTAGLTFGRRSWTAALFRGEFNLGGLPL